MTSDRRINRRYCTATLHVDYPHVGVFDVAGQKAWIARRDRETPPLQLAHARMLVGAAPDTSTADKDRFVCFWFHVPGSGAGFVHGYPIEWSEGHLLVRLDPNWNHATRRFIAPTETARIERNIEQQYDWGRRLFETYLAQRPPFPLSWHMVGPRPIDSMFYIQRVEPG